MKHLGKQKGIISNECSSCGGDLGNRFGKQRYCHSCHARHMRETRPKHSDMSDHARIKANTRAYTNVLIKRGKLSRGNCEVCNTSIRVEAHHDDYKNPRQVRWFCRKHHLKEHGKLKD